MDSSTAINKHRILLLLLILAGQKYEQVASYYFGKVEVAVQNFIDFNRVLYMNCSSEDDDLGKQWLQFRKVFRWKFYINFWGTTKFSCYMMWKEGNAKFKGTFDIYDAKRDEDRCLDKCYWKILKEGIYSYEPDEGMFKRHYEWTLPYEYIRKGRIGKFPPPLPNSA